MTDVLFEIERMQSNSSILTDYQLTLRAREQTRLDEGNRHITEETYCEKSFLGHISLKNNGQS
jgi:hypothetical protein